VNGAFVESCDLSVEEVDVKHEGGLIPEHSKRDPG
jgi:hypothetical protein